MVESTNPEPEKDDRPSNPPASRDSINIDQISGGTVAVGAGAQAIEHYHESMPKPPPPLQSLGLRRGEKFTGRDKELAWLLEALQPGRAVTLWGPGGIGKSALAQAVLDRLIVDGRPPERFPDGVITFSFYGQPETAAFAAHIVRSLVGETAQDIGPDAARRALSQKSTLLIVLDGAEQVEDLSAVLRLCAGNGLLLTSRDKGDAPDSQWRRQVGRLSAEETWTLLQNWDIAGLDEEMGQAIHRLVDGWPLAIQIIGRYLDVTGEAVQTYWDWLQNAPIEALSHGERGQESAAILLNRSLEQLSPGAQQVLGLVGLLAPAPFPGDLLVESLELPDHGVERGIGELVRYGLLRREGEQLEAGHALIHAYARSLPGSDLKAAFALAQILSEKTEALGATPVLLLPWLSHFMAAVDDIIGRSEDAQAADLAKDLGHDLILVANYAQARKYYEAALFLDEKIWGPDHSETATTLNNLGLVFNNQGDFAQALPYFERALAIYEKEYGPDNLDLTATLNNLGSLLQAEGDYEGARSYYEHVLAIREKALGSDHPSTAVSLNNLGALLEDMGDYAEALPYFQRALVIHENAFGPEHTNTATSLNNLGNLLHDMGDYVGAQAYYERALTIKEKVLGPEHPDTGTSLNNLGNLHQDLGDYEGARGFFESALAISEKVLGKEHPVTAIRLNNLGYLLRDMGDYEGARLYYDRALAIREKVLGPEHPDTASSLNHIGSLLRMQGDSTEALPYYQSALAIDEKVLGPEHPNIAIDLNNLGSLLFDQRDYDGAQAYYERALAIREKSLGSDHPDTAQSLNNLGSLLYYLGDDDGARPYYERALAIFEKALGPDHPSTVVVRENLNSLYPAPELD